MSPGKQSHRVIVILCRLTIISVTHLLMCSELFLQYCQSLLNMTDKQNQFFLQDEQDKFETSDFSALLRSEFPVLHEVILREPPLRLHLFLEHTGRLQENSLMNGTDSNLGLPEPQ